MTSTETWLLLGAALALAAWYFLFRSLVKGPPEYHDNPDKVRVGAAIYSALMTVATLGPIATIIPLWGENSYWMIAIASALFVPAFWILKSDYLFRTPWIGAYIFAYSLAASRHGEVLSHEEVERLEKLQHELGL